MCHALAGRGGHPVHFLLSGCLLKKNAFLFALLFLAAPVVNAYDFGTAGIIAGLTTAGAVLALTFGAPAAIGVASIGALVMGIEFSPSVPTAGQTPVIEAQLSPAAKLSTPAGWTAPSGSSVEPSPPTGASGIPTFCQAYASCPQPALIGNAGWRASADEACATASTGAHAEIDSTGAWARCISASGNGFSGGMQTMACPSGYIASGSNCILSDPNSVPKPDDGRCTIKRTGNSFGVDPRDPDCASGKIPATTSVTPNQITSSAPDGSTKSVTINPDGSSTVTESRPNTASNTTETNTTTMSAPDASGAIKVTGQGSGVAPGTGTQAGNSSAPVNFDKSGLATEGTLGGIKSSVDAIKNGLDPGTADSTLSAQKSAFDSAVDSITGMFSGESGRSSGIADDFSLSGFLPAQCGCTPLTINFHGHTASFDWCTPMQTFKGALAWVLGLFSALYILSLFRLGGGK